MKVSDDFLKGLGLVSPLPGFALLCLLLSELLSSLHLAPADEH